MFWTSLSRKIRATDQTCGQPVHSEEVQAITAPSHTSWI